MTYCDQGFAPVRLPFQGMQTISEIMRPTVYNRFRLISFKAGKVYYFEQVSELTLQANAVLFR